MRSVRSDSLLHERTTGSPSCDRYELGGVPLAYQADQVFDRLFPPSSGPSEGGVLPERKYNPNAIPPCPICGAKRVFECQLMPNILNVLKPSTSPTEKPKEVDSSSGGGSNPFDERGMEWGTCLIFTCSEDCRISEHGSEKLSNCWREELVLVQWEQTT